MYKENNKVNYYLLTIQIHQLSSLFTLAAPILSFASFASLQKYLGKKSQTLCHLTLCHPMGISKTYWHFLNRITALLSSLLKWLSNAQSMAKLPWFSQKVYDIFMGHFVSAVSLDHNVELGFCFLFLFIRERGEKDGGGRWKRERDKNKDKE